MVGKKTPRGSGAPGRMVVLFSVFPLARYLFPLARYLAGGLATHAVGFVNDIDSNLFERRHVLTCMVCAEEEFARRHFYPDVRLRAARITAVSGGQ